MSRWEDMLRAVAGHENVLAKISGLNTTVTYPHWFAADWSRPVEAALDCFGPDRLMCGSDWPVALMNGDYARVSNARRIYRLEVPTRAA